MGNGERSERVKVLLIKGYFICNIIIDYISIILIYVNAFILATCVLNGRKMIALILWMMKIVKI